MPMHRAASPPGSALDGARRLAEAGDPMRRPARRTLRLRPMRRLVVAWLLAVGVAGVLGAVQAQAAAREHACCRNAPVRADAPPAPCQSLLPLACCDATVLPATAPHAPDRPDLGAALPLASPARLGAAGAFATPSDVGLAHRVSPLRLSVVLLL
jgi:hypothetical protein